MTALREAAQQALEALEAIREADTAGATPKMVVEARKMYEPTIIALRAALAEPIEPVAWIHTDPEKGRVKFLEWRENEPGYRGDWIKTPLYAAPPHRKPLTKEEIKQLLIEHAGMTVAFSEVDLRFARAIERAHGIGGDE